MARRQEEKEARRRARLEAEAKEAKAAASRRRLQLVFGGVLGALIVGGVIVGVLAASGGNTDKNGPRTAVASNIKLPTPQTADLQTAVDAAGCSTASHPIEGRNHEDKVFTESDYKTNPPTSGNHFPNWAQDGIYDSNTEPQLGKLVHPLEHGRVEIQYKPGTPQPIIDKLEAFLAESDPSGYHELLFPNETNMTPEIAATAWGFSLDCPKYNDKIFDALRTFRDAHIDNGPETVP
jgi:hypothetical protein